MLGLKERRIELFKLGAHMNKGKFPHDKKQQKNPFQSQGHKPQWPGHNPNQEPNKHNPGHNPEHNPNNPNKPQWPGQKDKR